MKADENAAYTIDEAVDRICAPGMLAEYLRGIFYQNLYFNMGGFCIELAGYQWRNPHNLGGATMAAFPRRAYFEVWKINRGGMLCPKWFSDFLDEEYEVITGRPLFSLEHAPADFLDWDGEGMAPPPVSDKAASADSAGIPLAAEAETRPAPATPTGLEICDGLTVDAVRKALEAYPALKDLLMATAEVMARPDGGLAAKDGAAIVASFSSKLAKRGGGWGRGDAGAVGKEQGEQIKTLFEVAKNPGRRATPKKIGRPISAQ